MSERDVGTITVNQEKLLKFKASVALVSAQNGQRKTMKETIEDLMDRYCSDPSFFAQNYRERNV